MTSHAMRAPSFQPGRRGCGCHPRAGSEGTGDTGKNRQERKIPACFLIAGPVLFEEFLRQPRDVFRRKAVFPEDPLGGGGGAEMVDAQHLAV